MTTNDFIQQCKNSGKFTAGQMWDIRWSFEHGLTIEQIKILAKPEFNKSQMQEICYGFEDGLTIKQVELFADPKFNWKQMKKICEFIINNKDIPINTLKFLIQLEVL